MALYAIAQGGLVNALDTQQIVNLLTGNMVDQQVSISNRIRAQATGAAVGSGGYIGHESSGAPGTGTWNTGDFVVDQTNATVWVCTAGGTPGTWVKAGDYLLSSTNTWTNAATFSSTLTVNAEATAKDFKATGVASLTNAQNGRYVGSWTTAGPPAGLTGAVGDFGFDSLGNMWFCSVAGSPGTWRAIGGTHRIDQQSGSSTASVTHTIPSAMVGQYPVLILYLTARSDNAGSQVVNVQFNGDTAGNYDAQVITDTNTTITGAAPNVGATSMPNNLVAVASGAPAGSVSFNELVILNADSTTLEKPVRSHVYWSDADTAATMSLRWGGGKWRNTSAAISSIKLTPNVGNLVNWRSTLVGVSSVI